jgi:hypothetical protein
MVAAKPATHGSTGSQRRTPSTDATKEDRSGAPVWSLPVVAAIAIAVVAVGLAAAWILDGATSTKAGTNFISKPQFVLWLVIFCGQTAVWALAVVPVWRIGFRTGRWLRERGALPWRAIGGVLAAVVLLVGLAALFSLPPGVLRRVGPFHVLARSLRQLPQGHEWPLPDHVRKVETMTACAFAVGVGAIIGVWLVGFAFRELSRDRFPSARTLTHFLQLRDELNVLLAIVGTIVGLGTLATGALRNAVVAVGVKFPSQYVLIFGLYYSALIALAYAPSYVAMRAAGEAIRDRGAPLVSPLDPKFGDVVAKRKTLDELMQLNLSASSSFKAGVAILTPLAGSLVALLIGKK